MSRIARSTVDEVQNRLDAVAVVNDYVRLEKRGGRWLGLCPFHNEKTPSFQVNPDLKLYYCFGCHKGGTALGFFMEMEKLSFPEAVESLAKRLGIEITYENTGSMERDEEKDRERSKRIEELTELNRRVAVTFHHFLMEKDEGRAAKEYILSRGISEEMIDRFRLGYAPPDRSWLFSFLSQKGYSPEFLGGSGLFSENYPGSAFFANRLMFPIADRQGRTVAFGGRLLPGADEKRGKYINTRETELYKKGQTLFAIDQALPAIRQTKEAYLAEGYMDVIALHQAGITNAVAPLGTAFTPEQAGLLRRFAQRIYLVFDSDSAGRAAAVKAILTCRKSGVESFVVSFQEKDCKDPADVLKNYGPEALQKNAKCCILDFDYLLNCSKDLFDSTNSGGKAKAAAFIFPYLETLDSEVSRDGCITLMADALRIDRQAVFSDYRAFVSRSGDSRRVSLSPEAGREADVPLRMNDELFLLTAIIANVDLYPRWRAALLFEELEDPNARELFIALEEWYRDDMPGMDDLLSRIPGGALRTFVIQRAASEAFSVKPERLIEDGMNRVKQKRLERRRMEILIGLGSAEKGESRSLDELLAEKVYLDAELRNLKEASQ